MIQVIGVRFKDNGKIYYFSTGDLDVEVGNNVIVETARGIEYGKVVLGKREVEEEKIISTLKPVIRIATKEDDQIQETNKIKSKEAFRICLEKIKKHELDMKLIDCEYTFDNNKILFYFTADGRIDFRNLVKDIASVFKTRIELRQIGVRDETKIMGGIGICGRSLCCNTFLSEFIPVSIKMAKEQNLSLNPTKISGVCGRLMCCLKNEQETYEYLNSKLPNNGDEVKLPDGNKGIVQSVNVLRQLVKVIVTDEKGEKSLEEYSISDLNLKVKKKKEKIGKIDPKLKKLESMDRMDAGADKLDSYERPEKGMSDKADKTDRFDKADRAERSDRTEKTDRAEKADRGEKADRADRNDRVEKADRADRNDKADKADRGEKADRADRNERFDKRDRADKNDRFDKRDRGDKHEKSDNKHRSRRYDKGDKSEGKHKKHEHSDKKERKNKN